jgi:hypothetical protein
MTMNEPTSLHEKRTRWTTLWRKLHTVRFESLPTEDEVDRILAALPPRQPEETLSHWLKQAELSKRSVVVPFARPRFTPLVTIERLAASSKHEAFPLPEAPMISPDEAFRLTVVKIGEELELRVEALGFDAFQYAGCYIGVSSNSDLSGLIAVVLLDGEGNGSVRIDDTPEIRKSLAKPVLGLLESNHE